MFFLDSSHKICRVWCILVYIKVITIFFISTDFVVQRIRTTNATGEKGGWEDAKWLSLPSIKTSPTSQLAAVCDDENDATIHLYYQAEDGAIRSIVSHGDDGNWVHSSLVITDALPETALSAVSGASESRLFFQGKDGRIKEYYLDSEFEWRNGTFCAVEKPTTRFTLHCTEMFSSGSGKITIQKLQSRAPISAVAWNHGQPHFEIRVYSVISGNKLFGMSYGKSTRGWKAGAQVGKEDVVNNSTNNVSGIAAIRTSSDGTVNVFYLPEPRFIAVYNINAGARVPLWIPINLGPTSDPGSTPSAKEGTMETELEEVKKDRDKWQSLYEKVQQVR